MPSQPGRGFTLNWSRWSVRAQLAFLVLAALAPVFIGLAWHLAAQRQQARELAYDKVQVLSNQAAASLAQFLEQNGVLLGRFAARARVKALDAANCAPIFGEYVALHPEFTNIVVRDLAGDTVCSVLAGTAQTGTLKSFGWFQGALRAEGFQVGDGFAGPLAKRWVVMLSHPIRDDTGKISGVVMLPTDLLKLGQQQLASVPKDVLITVVDRAGTILMRSLEPDAYVGKPMPAPMLHEMLGRSEGLVSALGADGVRRLYAFTEVAGSGWKVVVGVREDAAFAALDATLRNSIGAALAVLVAALLVAWRISLGLVRPIEQLAQVAARVAGGDTSARVRPGNGSTEVESVARQFNQMLDTQARHERDLESREQTFRLMFDSNPVPQILQIARSRIVDVNAAFLALSGYSKADLLDRTVSEIGLWANPDEFARAAGILLRDGRLDAFEGKGRLRNGEERFILMSTCSLQIDGVLHFLHSMIDISERRHTEQALREREERLRFLLSRTSAVIYTSRASGDYGTTFVSDSVLGLLGYAAAEFMADPAFWTAHLHPGDAAGYFAARPALFVNDTLVYEYRFRHKDGGYRWIRDESRLYRDADGQATEVIGFWIDVTKRMEVQSALQESQDRYRALVECLQFGVGVHQGGKVVYLNPAGARIVGARSDEDWRGRPMLDFVHPQFRQQVIERVKHSLEHGAGLPLVEEKFVRCDGVVIDVEIQGTPISYQGQPAVQLGFVDITQRKHAERAMRESEARFRTLTELGSDWYWEQDDQFRFVQVEGNLGAADRALANNFIGLTRWDASADGATGEQWDAHRAMLRARRTFHGFEMRRPGSDGSLSWVSLSGAPIFDERGNFTGYRGIGRDITAQKQAEDQIHQLAFYDALSGLPNRRRLMEQLARSLLVKARSHRQGAVLFIDLDNFKSLNDTQGHDVGDLLLRQVAHRLSACVREVDTVARLGGDEFVVLLEELSEELPLAAAQAEAVAKKILLSLNQAYDLSGREHRSTPSIGVTLFGEHVPGVDELLKQADLAMYQAKAAGRNTLRFFDVGMQAAVDQRVAMEADLRLGLERRELLLHFQPVVQANGRVSGAEALVRWCSPERGMVAPGQFIALAEATGLILPLGQWVLETACAQLACWAAHPALAQLTLAVNVSAHQFRELEFVAQVLRSVQQSGANPGLLKLELTESLLAHNVEDVIDKMTALKAQGIGFSLDDFGTGYSSLSYLKRLPLDQLKIDQSFVRDVLSDPNDAAIARTIVALGDSLGLEVIAEGVETDGQRQFLSDHGCHAYQGYLFSRPLPGAAFDAFVIARQ